ncbi:MAG: hypothetical protein Q4F49_05155 [Pseudoxanthomonas suwonensis]|nr:hypothetical protein [Pseudoxanthomonas suwonensis]
MKRFNQWLQVAGCALLLSLSACKEQEAAAPVERPPVAVPTTEDRQAWGDYLNDVVTRNMQGVRNQPYVYLIPFDSDPEFEGKYVAIKEKAGGDVARGIVAGNMLAYAGLNSSNVADLVVEAFDGVQPDTMKGVKLLFIGDAADSPRVQEAVAASGVEYVHIDTSR